MIFSSPWGPGTGIFVAALDELPQGGLGDQELLTVATVANALAVQKIVYRVASEDTAEIRNDVCCREDFRKIVESGLMYTSV